MESSAPPYNPSQHATCSISVDNSPTVEPDELPSPPDEQKEQQDKTKDLDGTREQTTTKNRRAAAMKPIYSQYQRMAIQEDKDMVNRWTETLNILLTFAGLLSAVITAFLIASQPGLQQSPNATTDRILLNIARSIGNTTELPTLPKTPINPRRLPWALIWGHVSLGCSLMSAFGSLLCKQWILHFQSNPAWANTVEEQCRLREIRAYSMSKWRMYTIIESLPVLLQLSVFLFYLGLQESLYSISTFLWGLTTAIAIIIASFYSFTLFSGAFFPSCPFKSPITSSREAVVAIIALVALVSTLTFMTIWIVSAVLVVVLPALAILLCIVRIWFRSPPDFGEQQLTEESHGTLGVVSWWLMEHQLTEKTLDAGMQVVADTVQAMPNDALLKMVTWRGGFGRWCSQVFKALDSDWPSKATLRQADIICYLMHQSEECTRAIRRALAEYSLEWPRTPKLFGYVCSTLRKGWTLCPIESTLMPVLSMQPSTYAVYLQHQLLDWVYAEEFRKRSILEILLQTLPVGLQPRWVYGKGSERRLNGDLVLQELPAALQPQYFSDLDQFADDVINAVALAAVALVPDDTLPYLKPVEGLVNSALLERLLQAIHRLSFYPPDQVPVDLIPTVVASATRVITSVKETKELYDCASWKNGEFGESLYRLVHLGRVWWHAEVGERPSSPGASLVHEMHRLVYIVVKHAINGHCTGGLNMLFPTPEDVQEVLATYAHPSGPDAVSLEHAIEATELLHAILDLRYLSVSTNPPTSRFHLWSIPHVTWSTTPCFTFNPAEHPYVIRQLTHNLQTGPDHQRLKLASLSLVVRCRDVFLPEALRANFPHVASDIDELSEKVLQRDDLNTEEPWESYGTFNRWDELSGALEELERTVASLGPQTQTINTNAFATYSWKA